MDDVKLALLGDKEAARRLTEAGVLLPCPFCGADANIVAYDESLGKLDYILVGSIDQGTAFNTISSFCFKAKDMTLSMKPASLGTPARRS